MSLLRSVRNQLSFGGEYNKNVLYIFTEIMLITIGVSIAIQLNSWKDERENSKQTIVLLQQLDVEFKQFKAVTSVAIEKLKEGRNSIKVLYKACGKENNFTNYELGVLFTEAQTYTRIEFNMVTLNESINTGRISLIENPELRLLLSSFGRGMELIENRITYMSDISVKHEEVTMKYIPWRDFDNVYFPDLELGNSELNFNANDIFKDPLFENNIGQKFWFNQELEDLYNEKIIVKVEKALELIHIELEL